MFQMYGRSKRVRQRGEGSLLGDAQINPQIMVTIVLCMSVFWSTKKNGKLQMGEVSTTSKKRGGSVLLQEHMMSSHEICLPGLLLLSLRGSSALTDFLGECSGKLPRAVKRLTRAVETLPSCSGNHIHSAVESCPLQLYMLVTRLEQAFAARRLWPSVQSPRQR